MRRRSLVALLLVLSLAAAKGGVAGAVPIEERVRETYPSILAAWASGESDRAIDELAVLEMDIVRPNKARRDIEALWRAKLGVIRDTIERGSLGILVPIMLLHHDAYRHYLTLTRPLLAAHSQKMSAELAEYYAANSKSPFAARTAGDLLASLGGHLQSGLVVRRGAELFDRALEVDPGNLAAQLGLGAIYERRGEIVEAELHFAAAVRLRPDSGEALLRHALCAKRLGEVEVARHELDRALALGGAEWVGRVAAQERARLVASPEARLEAAAEGAARFPDSSRYAIQLAFYLEQQRQTARALEIVSGISGSGEGESARYRYARWPDADLTTSRARLRQLAARQNHALAGASAASSSEAEAR